jgi:hypothetical protein
LNKERITTHSGEVVMSKNGKRIFYNEAGSLKSALMSNPGGQKVVLAEDVSTFAVASGRDFYYVNVDGELYRQNIRNMHNNPGGAFVAEHVLAQTLTISGKGTAFYIDNDGDLFSVNKTRKSRVRQEVQKIEANNSNAYYYYDASDGYFDIFRSSGNGRFSRLFFDIMLNTDSMEGWVGGDDLSEEREYQEEDWGDDWGDYDFDYDGDYDFDYDGDWGD